MNDDAPLPDPEHALDWHLEAIAREARAYAKPFTGDVDPDQGAWALHRLSNDDVARFMG